MKTYYHLPEGLIYDVSKSKFKDIEFELAVKYLKLKYSDIKTFENEFLFKLRKIDALKELTIHLKEFYDESSILNESELNHISNKGIYIEAKSIFEKQKSDESERTSFFHKYLEKIKDFLDEEMVENNLIVVNSFPNHKIIKTIDEYILKDTNSKIDLQIGRINKLTIQSPINSLVRESSNLKEIFLNKELSVLIVNSNEIETIELNENLEELEISANSLKKLKCNKNLRELFITNNQLENIELNENLSTLICNGNKLTTLILNKNLKELYCMGNQIKFLKLNEYLEILQIQSNPLEKIVLNKNVKAIELSLLNNELVEFDNSINNKKVKIHYYVD